MLSASLNGWSAKELTVGDSLKPTQSDTQHVSAGGARKRFSKGSVAASAWRTILFLSVISMAYFFIWVPWRSSRVKFLLFYGFGMIQIAAVYTQDLRESVMAFDAPPLFMNPFMSLFVTGLALLRFATGLIIGGRSKNWLEALL